jgi:hypothetical protein
MALPKIRGAGNGRAGLVLLLAAAVALGQLAEARTAYGQALSGLAVGSPLRNLVELKLTDAGGTPPNDGARG